MINESEENEFIAQRRGKLQVLREKGVAFPNDFRRNAFAKELIDLYDGRSNEDLMSNPIRVKIAGRMMTRRIMGKAAFAHLQDMSGRLQVYIKRDDLPEGVYAEFKHWDLGDILGVEGYVFKTQTGELSLHAEKLYLLTKSLRPLPEKFHGLTDQEIRYRQRYLDLIANESSRDIFMKRSKIIAEIRQFLVARDFLEVETPMMQTIPGGASARPFVTHHNALDMSLFLRISPELYLKRLVVGGFEKVFELNRNFRNEGISTRHNPEFTMLEFYQAYADYHDLMDLTEVLLRELAFSIVGSLQVPYQEDCYDFEKPFARLTVKEALLQYNADLDQAAVENMEFMRQKAKQLNCKLTGQEGLGMLQLLVFEETVEHHLKNPTFITAYPKEASPLARCNDANSEITDRFELFIGGREIANGFSELNDAEDQAERFRQQVLAKEAGNDEAMHYDADYVCALEYGLPPTAGEGIGIDRLVMLLTNQPSIRDVLLFPHLRLK
jgi:lysyl-tRNA synthetase, class II